MKTPDKTFVLADRARENNNRDPAGRMLFKIRQDVVSRSLVSAVAECYFDYQVELVSYVPDNEDGVALIALQLDRDADAAAEIGHIRRHYPETAMAVLVSSPGQAPTGIQDLIGRGTVQGVVPLTLSLSVWLAAFGLLLNGGTYLPPEIMARRPQNGEAPSFRPAQENSGTQQDGHDPSPPQDDLTNREQEVLQLLSKGFQNKIIASRMNLSEYTVKVHVHNIIRKLHVHNRTQAAAYWLEAGARRPDRPRG